MHRCSHHKLVLCWNVFWLNFFDLSVSIPHLYLKILLLQSYQNLPTLRTSLVHSTSSGVLSLQWVITKLKILLFLQDMRTVGKDSPNYFHLKKQKLKAWSCHHHVELQVQNYVSQLFFLFLTNNKYRGYLLGTNSFSSFRCNKTVITIHVKIK